MNQIFLAVSTTNQDNRAFLQLAWQIKTAEGSIRLHNKPQTSYRSAYCQFTQLYFRWNVSLFSEPPETKQMKMVGDAWWEEINTDRLLMTLTQYIHP